MKKLNLLFLFCKLSLVGETEYRANFVMHLFESLMSFATGISVLWVVFSRTSNVGGWNWEELLVVLGLWFMAKGLVNMMIAPSIRQFMNDVWLGNLDYLLTKPENHQFMASTRKVFLFQGVDVLVGMMIMLTALARLGYKVGWQQVAMFGLSAFAGATILYAFWIALGTLSIWTVKLENLMLVFYSMFEAGRWPSGMYPFWLRYSLTFLVPIAFAITIPAEALMGRLRWPNVILALAWAGVSWFASKWFFNFAVRRRYMGASA